MSEVEARLPPSRGRSSTRGGRGGFGRGGPRASRKPVNGAPTESSMEDSLEDQGELGEMKRKYASELPMLKDMFPDWKDVDLVFALQETDGDVAATVDHITQGSVSQFAEVKKPKDRARSKVKEDSAVGGATDKPTARGGRGRGGFEGARGGRGRGSDRGRGGTRGGRGGHAITNGTQKDAAATSVPTAESSAWDTPATAETANGGWDTTDTDTAKEATADAGQSSWGNVVTSEATPAAASEGMKSSLIPEGGAKKSWASMFSQPKPAPAPAAPKQVPAASQPPPAELVASGEVAPKQEEAPETQKQPEPVPPAPSIQEPTPSVPEPSPAVPASAPEGEDLNITPSKDPLTEANVEHLPDESHAPATQTVASTAGSLDTRNLTPLTNLQAPIGSRPPMGGYAATAYRATGVPGRSASFQRRVQEQQEAVVMPGHNAVDRATVQFGSMGLNGAPDPDVDEDREEPETQKALQHSPPAQPKTSLPPAPRQVQEPSRQEVLPTPKQAPGLPPASQQNQQQMQDATMAPGLTQDQAQMNPTYDQYGRYPGMQQDSGAQQKQYDPFSHQAPSQYDQYGIQQAQAQPQQQQQPGHAGFGGISSAPNDNYSQYYTSNEQQRNQYNQYYGGGYGQQDHRNQIGQLQQDAGLGPQRSASGFGVGPNESAYASQAQQQVSIAPHLSQQTQTGGRDPSDEHVRKMLHVQIGRKLMMNLLPQARPTPSRVSAIHPDVQLEAGVMEAACDTPVSPRGTKLAPLLADITNRLPSALLSSPLPTVYLSSSSDLRYKQAQSRFGEAPGSGHNTPNPLMGGQQQPAPGAQHSQMQQGPAGAHQQQPQQGGYGASAAFPYGHPYYNSPYQAAYQNQFGGYSQPPQPGYGGGGYPAKQAGGMYGAQGGYGMGSHSSFDQHSSSPANSGAFGQNQQSSMRSASGMSSGLGGGLEDYGRASVQSGSHQSTAFGGGSMNDPFARSASGFGGQGGYGQQSMGGPEESLKAYHESKSGPSPALGQPGRPGSAANSAVGSAQSGLPPPQSQQSGFGYPGFPGQGGSQYGGLGGLGSHQQGQQSAMGGQGAYGQYGAGGFGQTYGGYGSRGGWGSQYGAH